MPGISAIFSTSHSKPVSAEFCSAIRNEMLHFPFYASHQIFAEDGVNVGYTGYKEYPIQVIDNKNYVVVLEGRIYNLEVGSLTETLCRVGEAHVQSNSALANELQRFLLSAEGEFILAIHDKARGRVVLANDLLGRLPLYYSEEAESLIVSRELKFIVPFLPQVAFSKEGVLEYLLYGFPFGENTLVDKIKFLSPATYLTFDTVSGASGKGTYHTLNIDTCVNRGDRAKMASDMHTIFMDALSHRVAWVDKSKTIVSLSGGFDSRATLAGLRKLGLRPTAVTAQSTEERSAREVAGFLQTDVYAIPQGHIESERAFADIVFLKDGLDCHPNLAQLYQNLQNLRDRFGGDIVYFTGIFGGEITRHSHPTGGLSSLDSLVHYLLNANDSYKFSTDRVAAILHVPKQRIHEHMRTYLSSFPEKKNSRKYARFRHEYDVRFAGEAEDRNRFYFWTISPYFAVPFFNYVMSIDESKKTSWLFRDFLFNIDPNTCKAKYFNYGLPLNIPCVLGALAFAEGMVRHVFVKNSIKRTKRLVKFCMRLVRPPREETRVVKNLRHELLEILKNSKPVREFFTNPDLPALIEKEIDTRGLDRMMIVFAYMDSATRWHAGLREKSPAA